MTRARPVQVLLSRRRLVAAAKISDNAMNHKQDANRNESRQSIHCIAASLDETHGFPRGLIQFLALLTFLRGCKEPTPRERYPRGSRAGLSTAAAPAMGAAAVFRAVSDYWFGTSSTRRFWARPSAVLLVATKFVFPHPCGLMRPSATSWSARYLTTALARRSESRRLNRTDPIARSSH